MKKQVLIIKTSSMGDIIHTLPALTDAIKHHPYLTFDWVVEQTFAEIPSWHNSVDRVIPIQLRQWRKRPFHTLKSTEFKTFIHQLRQKKYDLIIDAQGLIKSAWLTTVAKGKRVGFDYKTARESLASLFYQTKYSTDWQQHAVPRMRQLFADALKYTYDKSTVDYGLCLQRLPKSAYQNYIVFLHGTTWPTKHWPEFQWKILAEKFADTPYNILLPWGNLQELEQAKRIAEKFSYIEILPKMNLHGLAGILANANLVYAVDTGLGHLAAALNVPTISLFGATDAKLTGAYGQRQVHLSANFSCAPCLQKKCTHPDFKQGIPPCYYTLKPELAFEQGQLLLEQKK
ncbi:MAG: lipopolysaccharide heptosyltransferase I [Legionellales bacterium]|nr:lipopolysaccharide heptosyltransferase I [Legionellales bacterium]|tara:strand:- start:29 stop:1060 length:1032 start_codon:yes stop_codon:yes gene_type:complete